MLIHIILLREREGMSDAERTEMEEAVAALATVPGVGQMTHGRDISGRGQGYTYAAVMRFVDTDALQAYQVHETHQQVVAAFNRLSIDRLVIDYETGSSGISA
jgi:hypothetical protein